VAKKKKYQSDKSGTSDGAAEDAAEDVTQPFAGAQDTPDAGSPPLPDDADAPGTDTVAASDDTAATGGSPDAVGQSPDDAPDPDTDPDTTETSGDTDTTGTPPEDAAQNAAGDVTARDAGTLTGTEPTSGADDETPPPPEQPAARAADSADEPAPVIRTEQVTVRQGGVWSMLIGGIAAAGIGVAAAPYIYPHLPVWAVTAPAGDGLAERLDEQAQRISDIGSRIDAMPAPVDPSDEISALSETVTSLTGRVANLEVQVTNLADRPAPEAPAATGAALDELRARLDAQRAEIADLRASRQAEEQAARDSARAILRRAALTRVMTALDTGDEFTAALADLRETGTTVPEALVEVSGTGVPTRAQLVESFPDAARAALAAARAAETGDGMSVRGFLQAQLGVRSLAPRAGDDPDAVLSRAEAALAQGRLGDTLAEIGSLPKNARAAMSDWAAKAAARHNALTAAEALSAELN
jgi:hypothetical protein